MSVGKNISTIRKNARLTIKDVSMMSNVAPSIISMVENDKANPSLSTLTALARVLGVDVSRFFDSPTHASSSPLTRVCDRKAIGSASGWTSSVVVDDAAHAFSICSTTLESGALEKSTDEQQLFSTFRTGVEFAYVLSGKVRLELGEELYILNAGDVIRYPNTARRRVANIFSGPSEILWITLGESGTDAAGPCPDTV